MNWNIEKVNNTLHITLNVKHIRNTNSTPNTYDTAYVVNYLNQQGIAFEEVITEAIVYNCQTQPRCTGTWVFSLPRKKKTTKPIEKKETVSKITNKKTIKK